MLLSILLLDDDPVVQQLIATFLRELSLSIDLFANGDDALACYREARPYDLVITDHGHPGFWGIDFIDAVRP